MDDIDRRLKHWRDAGRVARRALEEMREQIKPGMSWHELITNAETYIRRHGGKPAFPSTVAVDHFAAHFTSEHTERAPEGWDRDMIFQKGDLVKIDIGVHIKGCIGDNALTVEVGNGGNHTEQILASREARDAAIEQLHPGTPWHKVGEAAGQAALNHGFEPIRNLCGHQLEPNVLHAGVSVPSYACGPTHAGFKGTVQEDSFFAVEPFNTTGSSGMVENVPPRNSSNIYRVTGDVDIKRARASGQLKPLGAMMASILEERYGTLPFAERWAFPLLEKPFPGEDEESRQSKWNALVKKLSSIGFLETYHALRCADGGLIGQFEHTVWISPGGPEVLTIE